MFNKIFIAGISAVIVLVIVHFIYLRFIKKYRFPKPDIKWIWPLSKEKFCNNFWHLINVLIALALFVCFVILFASGFYNPLIKGENMSGYLMMIHVPVSGAFSVLFLLYLIFAADKMKLALKLPFIKTSEMSEPLSISGCISKLCFWLLCVLFLPLLLSILLSMFKLFGTDIQHVFMEMHKITALIFTLIGIIFLYTSLISGINKN